MRYRDTFDTSTFSRFLPSYVIEGVGITQSELLAETVLKAHGVDDMIPAPDVAASQGGSVVRTSRWGIYYMRNSACQH